MKIIYFQMITNISGEFQQSSNDTQILHNNIRHLQLKFKIKKYTSGNINRNSDTVNQAGPVHNYQDKFLCVYKEDNI